MLLLSQIWLESEDSFRNGSRSRNGSIGKFRISALDQGNQPIADAIKKQNLISLLPVLTSLGVPADKLKEEIIRSYELPEDFLKMPEPEPVAPKVGSRSVPDEGALQEGTPTQQTTGAGQLANALVGSADQIQGE